MWLLQVLVVRQHPSVDAHFYSPWVEGLGVMEVTNLAGFPCGDWDQMRLCALSVSICVVVSLLLPSVYSSFSLCLLGFVFYLFLSWPRCFIHCFDFSQHFLILSVFISVFHHYCPFPSVSFFPSPSVLCLSPLFPPTLLSREGFDARLISIHTGHSSAPCRSLSSKQEARSIRWLNGWIS